MLVSAAAGCASVGVGTQAVLQRAGEGPIDIQVEPCTDRTETPGRQLGSEATRAFDEKLRAATEFKVAKNARYSLACDVSAFVEGSAIKRWVSPGWGATVAQVSAMLTDTNTGEVMIIARANTTVSAGGLYTLGAEHYIVPSAVDNVVAQLRSWARGESPESGGRRGDAIERRIRQ